MNTDPYASEPAAQIPPDLYDEYENAALAVERWEKHLNRIEAEIKEILGDAHAGMVGRRKVFTYRPINTYRIKQLVAEYPELVQHFEREITNIQFDVNAFDKQHHEILEKYRSRSFRRVAE